MSLRFLVSTSLIAAFACPVFGQVPIDADASFVSYGSSFGGREILSIENNGKASVLVESGFYWTVTRFDASTGEYIQAYCSPYSTERIRDIHVADLTGDGALEVAVLREDGWVWPDPQNPHIF